MSTVLVTGGAGFIGSHLVEALVKRKHRVVVADNLSVGKKEYVSSRALFYKRDITTAQVADVFRKHRIEYIYHLAAQKNLQVSKKQPLHDADVNVLGTVRLLELARRHRVKKIVFYSTAAVYSPDAQPPNTESEPPQPVTPYGIGKYASELYITHSGTPYTILRLSNVYGPRQDAYGEGGVVAIFATHMARHQACRINNTGNQTRDYVYVGDVVTASIKSLHKASSEVLNISTGRETSVRKVHALLQSISHTEYDPGHGHVAEQYRSALNPRRARRVLSWHATTDLSQGLADTYKWFNEHYAN